MNGFLKMTVADYNAWLPTATAAYIADTNDTNCTACTFSRPDTNANYCWIRIECNIINYVNPQLLLNVIENENDAVLAGMIAIP